MPSEAPTFAATYQNTANIFFGRIKSSEKVGTEGNRYRIKVEIEKTWKGEARGIVALFTNANTCNPFGNDAQAGQNCFFFTSETMEIGSYPKCLVGSAAEMNKKKESFSAEIQKAEAKARLPQEDWFTCKQDADCVDINYSCAGAVVNKNFGKEASAFYSLENARTNCERLNLHKSEVVPFKVFCHEGKCGKQGINPKIGLSSQRLWNQV